MNSPFGKPVVGSAFSRVTVGLLAGAALMLAQDPANTPLPPDASQQQNTAPGGRWRRVGEPPQTQQAANPSNPGEGPELGDPQNQPAESNRPPDNQGEPSNYVLPSRLIIQPGTYVTVRLNQALSSDVNQPGDAFTATLVRPVVVDGVIVAQRGQTLGGRVVEAKKAGRVEGVARLGIQLTDLPLVDGQQIPIQAQLISRSGGTSTGRDAGAIAGTTAAGAAIGAAVNGGVGAGVGAAAGVVASTIGVLLTRGHASVIYPETVLTFRVEAPINVSTERAPQAFRLVQPGDYDRPPQMQTRMGPPPANGGCAGYGCAAPPPPYYYGYGPGYYPGYYPYWGPTFAFSYGFWPRYYYGPRFYGGRGFYRGYHR